MTGLSRAQVTRLIAGYMACGQVRVATYVRHRFEPRYTPADTELLASIDEAHETLSGPATRAILKREFELYGKPEFERLAAISNGHLYNLRNSQRYRERRLNYTKTRPTTVSIGERRKPDPRGQPGFLRIDTVHQGDSAGPGQGAKGVYGHIDQAHADPIHSFYRDHLNPYLNYHRPCAQPEVESDPKGRKRVRYKQYKTPFEALAALENPSRFLRNGLTVDDLKRVQMAKSDTDAARAMQQAKAKLFDRIQSPT
jgi:hypothetical protein